jgi:hypothetical protein
MRTALLLVGLAALSSCDRIPFLRNMGTPGLHKRQGEAVAVDCGRVDGRPPHEDCISKRLACGDTVKSTTAGSVSTYGDEFYRAKYCLPSLGGYSGPDRIYLFELPAQTTADIYLDGDCADLDLFAFRWSFEGKCPGMGHPITECEADGGKKGSGHVHVESVTRAAQYYVVVDGKDGVTAPFALTVECARRM